MISLVLKKPIGIIGAGSPDKVKSWIYDPVGSEIKIRQIRSHIHFLGSMHMSAPSVSRLGASIGDGQWMGSGHSALAPQKRAADRSLRFTLSPLDGSSSECL